MEITYSLTDNRPMQIGLVVLQADETIERDMRKLLPETVEMLVTRVPSDTHVTQSSLQAMKRVLTQAAALLPQGASLRAVGYGCTSGTAEIGADNIAGLVQAGAETPAVTEPVSALIAACRSMNLSRIALLSPYVESVSDRLRHVLDAAGIEVVRFASFNEPSEEKVVRISPQSIVKGAVELGRPDDCDAVFLSCTNLRTLEIIETVEAIIGKPVLSSNQVLAWHLGQIGGLNMAPPNAGRLFAQKNA